jgi:hypothetical protein
MAARARWRDAKSLITTACVALCECGPALVRALVVTPPDLHALAERAERHPVHVAAASKAANGAAAAECAAPARVVELAPRRTCAARARKVAASGRVVRKLGGTLAS